MKLGVSYEVAFTPDGAHLVTVAAGRVVLWDLALRQQVAFARVPHASDVDVSPTGDRVVAVDTSGRCFAFALPSLDELWRTAKPRLGEGPGPLFGPGGEQVLQASWGGDLAVRDAATGEVVLHEHDDRGQLGSLTASPDRSTFVYAVTTEGEAIVSARRWPFDAHAPGEAIRIADRRPSSTALALDDRGRLAVRELKRLSVWDLPTGRRLAERATELSAAGDGLAWSPDGAELAATDATRNPGTVEKRTRVVAFDPALEQRWERELPYACAVAYAPSGDALALGSWQSGVLRERPRP